MKILLLRSFDKLNDKYETFSIGHYQNYTSIERMLYDYEVYLHNHKYNLLNIHSIEYIDDNFLFERRIFKISS